MNKQLNLEIGTKFGKWKIASKETTRKNNLTHWICECECGTLERVPLNNLMNGSSTQCRSCAAKESGMKRRTGHGLISGQMWSQLKSNAKKRGHKFDLRIEEAWDRFEYQDRKCELTDEEITLTGYPYDKEKTTAVLTLINEDEGYKINNIIWIHRRIAKMKSKMSLDEFLELTYKISLNSVKVS
jgi:hypothetical protein